MVALPSGSTGSTRRADPVPSAPPLLWRVLLWLDRVVVGWTGRLVVTGSVPAGQRRRPMLLAANHIGNFDPLVLMAACRRAGIAPRFMATGGLFDTPGLGWILRRSGHVRINRGKADVTAALGDAVAALDRGGPIILYPEGRISLDPGLWPERGKTGVARMALASGAPVIPVSQWGAHEAVIWGSLTVSSWRDVTPMLASYLRAIRRRPTFRVHFGEPIDLADLDVARPGDAVRARDRIMRAITADLAPLRAAEPEVPAFADPTRPHTKASPWRP